MLLLESWGVPETILGPVRAHYGLPGATDAGLRRRRAVLSAAESLARVLTVRGFALDTWKAPREVADQLPLPAPVVAGLAGELAVELRPLLEIFEVTETEPTGELYERRRDGAAQMMQRYDFEDLASLVDLATDVDTGTGLLGRGGFEQVLEVFHRRANQLRRPIGLLVLELENLDDVPVERRSGIVGQIFGAIAGRLAGLVRRTDAHARIRFDQLAILAPGCATSNLPMVAERVQAGIEEAPLDIDDGALRVQVVIGIAATTPHYDRRDPRELLSSACSAVEYADQAPKRIFLANS